MNNETNDIKFSVLMSVYYKEKKENLKLAIDSLLSQTVLPNEIVIVEDGPLTDELNDCIQSFSQSNSSFKVIKLPENVGLGKALNEGLKHCSYEYVARMDSDDISLPDRFEKQINFLKNERNCDVIGGDILEFDDSTGLDISYRRVPRTETEIKKYLKKRNPVNHVTVLFKKDSVIEAGGYMDCPYFEDYYLWARMIEKRMHIVNIDSTLVRVRAGLQMSSRRGNFKYIKCIVNFEKKLLKMKQINIFDFLFNLFTRSIVAIIPNRIRYDIYQRRLRNG